MTGNLKSIKSKTKIMNTIIGKYSENKDLICQTIDVFYFLLKFLNRYLIYTLDQYVENDYTLVYFHNGLNSSNKPSLSWLWQAFKAFDRKYKKNLKALFLVHPTNFIRIIMQLFKPVIRYSNHLLVISFQIIKN
jgi:hypothetical protein